MYRMDTSYTKNVLYIFDIFFHEESSPHPTARSYYSIEKLPINGTSFIDFMRINFVQHMYVCFKLTLQLAQNLREWIISMVCKLLLVFSFNWFVFYFFITTYILCKLINYYQYFSEKTYQLNPQKVVTWKNHHKIRIVKHINKVTKRNYLNFKWFDKKSKIIQCLKFYIPSSIEKSTGTIFTCSL